MDVEIRKTLSTVTRGDVSLSLLIQPIYCLFFIVTLFTPNNCKL